ncbi:syntaxin-6-like [Narcine bancroftii]|uniref:syntaxin-6-like n=1 Tax=Narcine bancroftii TaxID=1343680 RepID=UPI00383126A1
MTSRKSWKFQKKEASSQNQGAWYRGGWASGFCSICLKVATRLMGVLYDVGCLLEAMPRKDALNGREVETRGSLLDPNTNVIVKKTRQSLYFLRCLRMFGLTSETLENFYKGAVESVLTCCIMVCCSLSPQCELILDSQQTTVSLTHLACVCREVQKAVNTTRGLYQRWCELLQNTYSVSKEEYDWTTNELRNSLRSIEWDLEDLDETIGIVESNPRKFKIETGELFERKEFVVRTRQTVKQMKDHISSPAAVAFADRSERQNLFEGMDPLKKPTDQYRRLDQELETANSQYIEEQRVQQRLIVDQQDQQLELVSGSIGVLKNMSGRIGDELDEQAVMLDEFSHEMDNTHSRLNSTLKKLAKASHLTTARRQWCVIVALLVILIVVLILIFTL